jgi:hypothetical protein
MQDVPVSSEAVICQLLKGSPEQRAGPSSTVLHCAYLRAVACCGQDDECRTVQTTVHTLLYGVGKTGKQ